MCPTGKPLAAGLHCHHGGKAVQVCPHPVMLYAAACTAMCAVFREVTSTLITDWLRIPQSAVRMSHTNAMSYLACTASAGSAAREDLAAPGRCSACQWLTDCTKDSCTPGDGAGQRTYSVCRPTHDDVSVLIHMHQAALPGVGSARCIRRSLCCSLIDVGTCNSMQSAWTCIHEPAARYRHVTHLNQPLAVLHAAQHTRSTTGRR